MIRTLSQRLADPQPRGSLDPLDNEAERIAGDIRSSPSSQSNHAYNGSVRTSLLLFLVAAISVTVPALAQGPNTWTTGAPLPSAVQGPATGVIGGLVYVVGGAIQDGASVSINQIYNPNTNSWTAGPAMPTARFVPASAVVNNILYVIGGNSNGNQLTVVEAFDPASNTFTDAINAGHAVTLVNAEPNMILIHDPARKRSISSPPLADFRARRLA